LDAGEGAAGRRSGKRGAEVWNTPESGAIVMEIYARRRHRANVSVQAASSSKKREKVISLCK
jgi:hypothetical protein